MGIITEFLGIQKSMSAVKSYKMVIKKYLEFIYRNELKSRLRNRNEMEVYEEFAEKYINSNRDFGKDLVRFTVYLQKKEYAPKTVNLMVSAVSVWFKWNNITIEPRYLEILKKKKPDSEAISNEVKLDKEKIRKILDFADVKMKALILVLATSGMRIGEATNIKLKDLKLDKDPPEIIVRREYTKTKKERKVYITNEAKNYLLSWLKIREKYIKEKIEKTKNFDIIMQEDDDRVFPFSVIEAEREFIKVLKAAGLYEKDDRTGRSTIRLHSLRKFFKISLLRSGVPSEATEKLLGHSNKKLELVYSKFTDDQLREFYKRAKLELTFYGEENVGRVVVMFIFN